MPFLDDPFEKDEDQEGLQLAQGQAGRTTPAAPGAATPKPAAGPSNASGQYVNFERYFNANKDAATATGNKLAGGIEKQGQGVQDELAKRQGAFGQSVSAGLGAAATAPTKAPSESPGEPRSEPTGRGRPSMPTTPAAAEAATPALPPQQPVQWAGPNSLHEGEGWNELVSQAGTTASQAANAATPGGLQGLLQQQQKGAAYSPGQSRFDAGLVGATSGDKFAALRERFGGLSKSLGVADAASVKQSGDAQARVAGYNSKLASDAARIEAERKAELRDWQAQQDARSKALADAAKGLTPGAPVQQVKPKYEDVDKDFGYTSNFQTGVRPSQIFSQDVYDRMSPDEFKSFKDAVMAYQQMADRYQWEPPAARDSRPDVAEALAAANKVIEEIRSRYGGR